MSITFDKDWKLWRAHLLRANGRFVHFVVHTYYIVQYRAFIKALHYCALSQCTNFSPIVILLPSFSKQLHETTVVL